MAQIAPTSQVTICRNVPLSPDYVHTLDFANRTLQGAYFASKAKFVSSNYTYVRATGSIKVELTMEQLIDCNYLFYNNVNFENKTFYCFITSIEYINNAVTQINFEEDVVQTWYMDTTWRQCFVEREHVLDDSIGANLVPEDLELGEYVVDAQTTAGLTSSWDTVIAAGVTRNSAGYWARFKGYNYTSLAQNPIYTGLAFDVIDCSTVAGFTKVGEEIGSIEDAGFADAIVSIFMVPHGTFTGGLTAQKTQAVANKPTAGSTRINGYIPRNNKLYTYPYRYLRVHNGEGQEGVYRFEMFSGNQISMRLSFTGNINFAIIANPVNYKGMSVDPAGIVLTNFPVCGYTIDSFKAWWAQNNIIYQQALDEINPQGRIGSHRYAIQNDDIKFNTRMEQMSALAGGVGSLLSLNFGGVANNAVSGALATARGQHEREVLSSKANVDYQAKIAQNMAQVEAHRINSINCVYSGGADANAGAKIKDLYFSVMNITAQFAQRIDSYFDMYGYACNRVKVPETLSRRNYNYVKCSNCNLAGSIPQYAITALNTLFNRGITIWHNPLFIGDYSVNNDIIGNG